MTAPADPTAVSGCAAQRRVVLITGLSGAGRSSMLHVLEDIGYEAVDNPPLHMMEELVARGDRPVAIGVDTRSRGFDTDAVLTLLGRLRLNPALRPELVFAWADEAALLRRYTETRRRHPMALHGRVADGIAEEAALLEPLREAADLVLDTSRLAIPIMRNAIERRFGTMDEAAGMTVSVMSFSYSRGLPPDADLVFDVRFLRNPHYDPILRPGTGLDEPVTRFVAADAAFRAVFGQGDRPVNNALAPLRAGGQEIRGHSDRLHRWPSSLCLCGAMSGGSSLRDGCAGRCV